MRCVDTNVLVYAYRADLPENREYREPPEGWANDDEPLRRPDRVLRAGSRHWDLFRQLTSDIEARGNDIPDAYLAAYALENNATLLSADRGFARFGRLRWHHPLDG